MKRKLFTLLIVTLISQNIFCGVPKQFISENSFEVFVEKSKKVKEGYLITGSVSFAGVSSPVKINTPLLYDKNKYIHIDDSDVEFDMSIENINVHVKGLTTDKQYPKHVTVHEVYFTSSYGKILFKDTDVTNETTDKRAKLGMFMSFQSPLEVPGISLEAFIRSAIQQKTGEHAEEC